MRKHQTYSVAFILVATVLTVLAQDLPPESAGLTIYSDIEVSEKKMLTFYLEFGRGANKKQMKLYPSTKEGHLMVVGQSCQKYRKLPIRRSLAQKVVCSISRAEDTENKSFKQ